VQTPSIRNSLLFEFHSTLTRPGKLYEIMTEWMNLSMLQALFPVFLDIRFRVQLEHYHQYSLWEHTLQCIKYFDLLVNQDETNETSNNLSTLLNLDYVRRLLPAALLLHDVGKSIQNAGHADLGVPLARDILKQCYFEPEEIDRICRLVRDHLKMSKFWQTHDLDDIARIQELAKHIGDRQQQTLLYLLTLCDSNATNSNLWNSYKMSLHDTLFARMHTLPEIVQEPFIEQESVELESASGFLWKATFVLPKEKSHIHLLSGTLTSLGCSTHSIQSTAQNNWVKNVYSITVPSYTKREVLQSKILDTINSGFINLESKVTELIHRQKTRIITKDHRPYPNNISLESPNPGQYELFVQTEDRPGLLYQLSKTLYEHNCVIRYAKVYTEAGWASDTFYLSSIPNERQLIAALQMALKK
jgi:UTP:GlnB (protein PII) uridylyltransferase